MITEILYSIDKITQDFFIAFGLFTFLIFLIRIFVKKPILNQIDEISCRFITVIGISYLITWIAGIIVRSFLMPANESHLMINEIFNTYWSHYLLQPLLWFLLSQLLRIHKVRKNIPLRLLIAFLFLFSIQKIVFSVIIFHRDYLPSSWTMYNELPFYPSNTIVTLLLKVIFFLFAVFIFNRIHNKLKNQ